MGNQLTPQLTREQAREVYARLGDKINRAMRRKLLRDIKHNRIFIEDDTPKFQGDLPTHISRPISHAEAVEQTTQMLMDGMAKHTHAGTAVTLKSVLDRAEQEIIERAFKAGQPIPRELVRAGIQEIYRRGELKRAESK